MHAVRSTHFIEFNTFTKLHVVLGRIQARKTRHQIRTVNIWMHKALTLLLEVLFSVTHTIFAC